MAALQADADFEVFLLRFFGGGKNAAYTGRVRGDRLLHEHVFARVHGVFEVERTVAGRAGDDDDIAAIDRFPIGIEAYELALFGDVDFNGWFAFVAGGGCYIALHALDPQLDAVLERICEGPKLSRAFGSERFDGGACTAVAATYERDFQRIIAGGMDGRRHCRRETSGGDGGGGGF
jgi:hypothetical protein